MVANRLTAPTDTIINIAVDYYGGHNLRDEFQKASRLKAIIKTYGNHDELATALYLQKRKSLCYTRACRPGEIVLYNDNCHHARGRDNHIDAPEDQTAIGKNDALMAEASGLKTEIEARSCDVSRLQNTLHSLPRQQVFTNRRLCQTYYESQRHQD